MHCLLQPEKLMILDVLNILNLFLPNLAQPKLAQPNLAEPNQAKHVINLPNHAHLNKVILSNEL